MKCGCNYDYHQCLLSSEHNIQVWRDIKNATIDEIWLSQNTSYKQTDSQQSLHEFVRSYNATVSSDIVQRCIEDDTLHLPVLESQSKPRFTRRTSVILSLYLLCECILYHIF